MRGGRRGRQRKRKRLSADDAAGCGLAPGNRDAELSDAFVENSWAMWTIIVINSAPMRLSRLPALLLVPSLICLGDAITVNGACEFGNCVTPDTLGIGLSTTISSAFTVTLANTDMYRVVITLPITNLGVLPGFASFQYANTTLTYLGNSSAGPSGADSLTIGILQNLASNSEFIDGNVTYSIYAQFGGAVSAASTGSVSYMDGPFSGGTVGPLTSAVPSGTSAPALYDGNFTNPSLDDIQETVNFGAGSPVGAYISVSDQAFAPELTNFQGGPSSAPVALDLPEVGEVTGTIGGQGTEDYYLFQWAGGAFSATGSITGTPNSGASYLFSEGAVGSCSSGGSGTLDSGDSFTSTIAFANLAPGEYCIGIDANNSNDPTFAINFNTPVAGTPEPTSVIFMSTMLLGIAFVQRKRLSMAYGLAARMRPLSAGRG